MKKNTFMKPLKPSKALAEVVGNKAMPRTEITKKIWAYIKRKDLQSKTDKTKIKADAKLKSLFGSRTQISMFDLPKIISKNVK